MTRFIAIIGGMKSGKTSTAINLTSALSQFGRSVILIDCHFKKPQVAFYLGLHDAKKTLQTSIKRAHNITEAIIRHPAQIFVIPGSDVPVELKKQHLDDIFVDLLNKAELVCIDTPNETDDEFLHVLESCDMVILVTLQDYEAVNDTVHLHKKAKEVGKRILGVVVSQAVQADEQEKPTLTYIEHVLDTPVIGVIPFDKHVVHAQKHKHPLPYAHFEAPATIGYKKLAANLIGEKYEVHSEKQSFQNYVKERMGF